MSKPKQQNPNQDAVTQELDAQRRELMKAISTHKVMKERLDRMENEREKFGRENNQVKQELNTNKLSFNDHIEQLVKEKEETQKQKEYFEFQNGILQRKMADIDEDYKKLIEQKRQLYESEKYSLQEKIKQLEANLEKISSFMQVKEQLEDEKNRLVETLAQERNDKKRELADKEKEKVKETDQLKKEMLHKIQETKSSLLALKKEQLETTTRLTVLQNHQLTTELEYQSKQTEKLLFKNSKLTEQVTSLKRDIEIHKQVEQELAKRSHFSQKLIKKLTTKIKELEDQQEQQEQERMEEDQKLDHEPIANVEEQLKEQEMKINQLERKLAKVQNDNDILRNENNHLLTKLDTIKYEDTKYTNLSVILANNLEFLKSNSTIEEVKESIDLQELREKNVNDWTISQKTAIMNILLTQAQQFLTKKNLSMTDNNNNTVPIEQTIVDNANKSVQLPKIGNDDDHQSQQGSKRFQGVPIDISTQIVKSNLRDWGKPAVSQPNSQLTRKYKLK